MDNKLGEFLRERRGTMSLRELAAKCQISHTHLDSLEKGADPRTGKHVSVSTETLRLIANGIDVDYLYLACLADGVDPNDVANISIPTRSSLKVGNAAPTGLDGLDEEEALLLENYRAMNKTGRDKLVEHSTDLVQSGNYFKNISSQKNA